MMVIPVLLALTAAVPAAWQTPAPSGALPPITNPVWAAKPTPAEVQAMVGYHSETRPGDVTLRCIATAEGRVSRCAVVVNTRPAAGYAEAALKCVPLFILQIPQGDGLPIADRSIDIRLSFRSPPTPGAVALAGPPGASPPP